MKTLIRVSLVLALAAGFALAQTKDILVPAATGVTVGGSAAGYSTGEIGGSGNQHATVSANVPSGSAVVVSASFNVNNVGTGTVYPRTVAFGATNELGSPVISPITVMASPNPCVYSSESSSCSVTASFTVPTVAVATDYQVRVKVSSDSGTSGKGFIDKYINFNFIVVPPVVPPTKTATALDVTQICALLRAGTVDLKALLTANSNPLSGKLVYFKVEGVAAGSALTDGNGVATLPYSVNSLTVGDKTIYAYFEEDASYLGSNDSATLGISYGFMGFMPPLNADGTSVFTSGRVLPLKVKIYDGQGAGGISDAVIDVELLLETGVGVGTDTEPASVATPDIGSRMRYDATADQYIYNWDLSPLANGTYKVGVDLNDSKACRSDLYLTTVTIKKKK